jgi:hypothetical protein
MNRNRKWKYVGKAVLSGVLVTSLLVGNIGYAEAKPISQEETIYVELAEDGSVKEVTVSDLLKQEGKENVTKEQKADKETKLPVDVTITYLLDGKEIAGKDRQKRKTYDPCKIHKPFHPEKEHQRQIRDVVYSVYNGDYDGSSVG